MMQRPPPAKRIQTANNFQIAYLLLFADGHALNRKWTDRAAVNKLGNLTFSPNPAGLAWMFSTTQVHH